MVKMSNKKIKQSDSVLYLLSLLNEVFKTQNEPNI